GASMGRATTTVGMPGAGKAAPGTGSRSGPPQGPARPRRFHRSVQIDPMRLGRDASRIAEEVVQHLTGMVGTRVEITHEIHAVLENGASDKLVRDITENCRTQRFTADRQRIANSGGSFIRHRIPPLNVSRSRHVQRRLVATPACTARRESVPGEWRRRAVIEWRSTDFSANL